MAASEKMGRKSKKANNAKGSLTASLPLLQAQLRKLQFARPCPSLQRVIVTGRLASWMQARLFALSGYKTREKHTANIDMCIFTFGKDSKTPQGLVRLARIEVEPDSHIHTAQPGDEINIMSGAQIGHAVNFANGVEKSRA